jgi:hypothetical protein
MTCHGGAEAERSEAKNLLLVVVEGCPGRASGSSRAHMLIAKWILRITSGVAIFALLLFMPAATLH